MHIILYSKIWDGLFNLFWLVYPIELETKDMTDIDRHALYPDLHLEI
jgi:hypothetical protein